MQQNTTKKAMNRPMSSICRLPEKTIRNEYDITYRLNIHVPQLVCYSPDAAYINYELAAM